MGISLTKLLRRYFNKAEWTIQESESVFPAIKGVCEEKRVTKITEIKNKKTGIKVSAEVFEDDDDIEVGLYSLCGLGRVHSSFKGSIKIYKLNNPYP